MLINSVKLINFRCYSAFECNFNSKKTILLGKNAIGKTSLIESIYMLALTKSPRTLFDKDIIKNGESGFYIEGKFVSSVNNKFSISYGADLEKRIIKKNQTVVKKSSDYVGLIDAVWFSANDLNLISGLPKERRTNFDRIICQISKVYFSALSNYKKLLKERNALLKWLILENKPNNKVLLESINNNLVLEGKKIIEIRRKIIEKINIFFSKKHIAISGANEVVQIKYCPNVKEDEFESLLLANQEEDLRRGNTGCGPHKDDYIFIINNKNIAIQGSQGQQRNAVLSLKLSEVELIYQEKKEYPILLLDDVFSELDKIRQNKLLSGLSDEIQVIITTTSIADIDKNVLEKIEIIHMKGDI